MKFIKGKWYKGDINGLIFYVKYREPYLLKDKHWASEAIDINKENQVATYHPDSGTFSELAIIEAAKDYEVRKYLPHYHIDLKSNDSFISTAITFEIKQRIKSLINSI